MSTTAPARVDATPAPTRPPAAGVPHALPVRLTAVSRRFDDRQVLHGIDLDIAAAETVAVVGPSGCGKSTLLRLVAGLDTPDAGTVAVGSRAVTDVDDRVAVVFQQARLLPWLTLAGNVALGATRRRRTDRSAGSRAEVRDLLDRVGLAGFADARPATVSGGMARRAAIARALIARPGVLLLDEPFAALDALTRLTMQDFVGELTAALGTTVVLVTHDVDEALRLADRVAVLGPAGSGACDVVDLPARDGTREPRDSGDPGTAATLAPLRRTLLRHAGLVA